MEYDLQPESAILALYLSGFNSPMAAKAFSIKYDQASAFILFDGVEYKLYSKECEEKIPSDFEFTVKSSDKNVSEEVKKITEKIKTKLSQFIDVEFQSFNISWGIKEGCDPFLLSFDELKFITNKNYGSIISELITFSAFERMKKSSSRCYINSDKCGIANLSMERSKILEHKIYGIVSKYPLNKRKRVFNEAYAFVKSLVPEIFKGSIRVCPLCYRRFSKQPTEIPRQSMSRTCTNFQNHSRGASRPSTSYERLQTVSVATRVPENRPIITPSGLRMSQNYSGQSYQLAHKLYGPHATPFSPYLKRPQRKF